MALKVGGVITAMLTPFTRGGRTVDYDKIGPLAHSLLKRGSSGLFVCGSTGEGQLLNVNERKALLEEVIAAVGKKATVIAHTGAMDTLTAQALTDHAAAVGAHAAAAVAPSFYRYDEAALVAHYRAICKAASGFPILLYNIPHFVGYPLLPHMAVRIAESVEGIAGIKDSAGDLSLLTHLVNIAPKGFVVINGCDNYGYQAFATGVDAAVSGTANVTIETYAAVARHVSNNEHKKALAQQLKLEAACRVMKYGGLFATYKESMRMLGLADPGYVRPPQRELTAVEKRALRKRWQDLGYKLD